MRSVAAAVAAAVVVVVVAVAAAAAAAAAAPVAACWQRCSGNGGRQRIGSNMATGMALAAATTTVLPLRAAAGHCVSGGDQKSRLVHLQVKAWQTRARTYTHAQQHMKVVKHLICVRH